MARHRFRTKNKGIGITTGRKRKRTTRVQRKSQRNGITRGENERGRAEIQTSILTQQTPDFSDQLKTKLNDKP